MARIKDENETGTSGGFIDPTDLEFEDYSMQMDERKNSYARNYIPTMEIEKECSQIL